MPILVHSTVPGNASQHSQLTVYTVKLLEQTPVWFWPMQTSTFPNNSWARLVVRAGQRPFNTGSLHKLPCLEGLKVYQYGCECFCASYSQCQIFIGMFNLLVQTQTPCLNHGASVLCTVLALWIYWRATLILPSRPKETSVLQERCIPKSNLNMQPGSSLNMYTTTQELGRAPGTAVQYVCCEIQAFLNLLTGQVTRLLQNRVVLA